MPTRPGWGVGARKAGPPIGTRQQVIQFQDRSQTYHSTVDRARCVDYIYSFWLDHSQSPKFPLGSIKATFIYLRLCSVPSLTHGAVYLKTLLFQSTDALFSFYSYYFYFNMAEEKAQGRQYCCMCKPVIWGICDHTEFPVVSDIQLPPCLTLSPPHHLLSGKYLN